MPKLIGSPTPIDSVGNKPKLCDEYVGLVNTGEPRVSITVVRSPARWEGTAQYGEYDEYRLVLKGMLRVEHAGGTTDCRGRPGASRGAPRVGAILDAPGRRRRLHQCVHASLFARHHPSGKERGEAVDFTLWPSWLLGRRSVRAIPGLPR